MICRDPTHSTGSWRACRIRRAKHGKRLARRAESHCYQDKRDARPRVPFFCDSTECVGVNTIPRDGHHSGLDAEQWFPGMPSPDDLMSASKEMIRGGAGSRQAQLSSTAGSIVCRMQGCLGQPAVAQLHPQRFLQAGVVQRQNDCFPSSWCRLNSCRPLQIAYITRCKLASALWWCGPLTGQSASRKTSST